jgi:hypothetical protein
MDDVQDVSNEDIADGHIRKYTAIGKQKPHQVHGDLKPGEKRILKINAYGKLNWYSFLISTGATVTIQYGSVEPNSAESVFYTRTLAVPILITIGRPLHLRNADYLLVTHESENMSDPEKIQEHSTIERRMSELPKLPLSSKSSYFFLTFDLSNTWNEPFDVSFQLYDEDDPTEISAQSTVVVHAGATKRIILPIKRILLEKHIAESAVPLPEGQQFIASKTAFVGETLRRALFWYKQALIGDLVVHGKLAAFWSCVDLLI